MLAYFLRATIMATVQQLSPEKTANERGDLMSTQFAGLHMSDYG
jgi:hypothetical protein